MMTEKEKQEVAAFRFSIIHEFVNGTKPPFGEQEKLLRAKCDQKWDIPGSDRTSIGRSTILQWISLYRESGGEIVSLFPKDRKDRGMARVYDTLLSRPGLECFSSMVLSPAPVIRMVINCLSPIC
jgi:putative transposase